MLIAIRPGTPIAPGAVAAPTAGLHFSDALLDALARKGVDLARITLHVGLGTFRPVETEDLTSLELHSEWIEVSPAVVERIRHCSGRVIAVGTTSVRALEGAAQIHGGELKPFTGPVDLGDSTPATTSVWCRVCSPTFIFPRVPCFCW